MALREAQEESGLSELKPLMWADNERAIFDVDVHWIAENAKEKGHFHYDCRYLFVAIEPNSLHRNHESSELKWFAIERAFEFVQDRSMLRQFHKLDFVAFRGGIRHRTPTEH